MVREVRALWQHWLANLDVVQADTGRTLFADLQDRTLRASWKTQIRARLQDIFAGAALKPIVDACQAIHDRGSITIHSLRAWLANSIGCSGRNA